MAEVAEQVLVEAFVTEAAVEALDGRVAGHNSNQSNQELTTMDLDHSLGACQDLIPIEQVFAKLKALLRKAAERTIEATWKRIGTLLNEFKPQECKNDLRNAGYASV